MLGALPLMLGAGTGSELRRPLGICDRRRAGGQPAADAVHHAGDLSGVRPAGAAVQAPLRRRGAGPAADRTQPRERRRDEHVAPFIARPVGTTLLTIAIALAGMLAYVQLPVAPLPQVDFPTIAVQAQLPGASPDTVATSLTEPLERHLGQIADVTEMTSQSQTGQTRIILQFALSRDINGAADDVQAAINAAQADLPTQSPDPADLPQGQSGRRAGDDPVPDLQDADARPDVRRGQQRDAAAAVAAAGRRPGDHRRRRAAGGAGGAQPAAAVPLRHRPGGHPLGAATTPTPTRRRAPSISARSAGRSTPTTRPTTPRTTGRWSWPTATAMRCS